MNTFLLHIVSPDGELFSGEVRMLTVRGANGDLAVLAGHIPFVTTLQPCTCKVILSDETEKTGTANGGLLSVSAEKTTLLSGSFHWN